MHGTRTIIKGDYTIDVSEVSEGNYEAVINRTQEKRVFGFVFGIIPWLKKQKVTFTVGRARHILSSDIWDVFEYVEDAMFYTMIFDELLSDIMVDYGVGGVFLASEAASANAFEKSFTGTFGEKVTLVLTSAEEDVSENVLPSVDESFDDDEFTKATSRDYVAPTSYEQHYNRDTIMQKPYDVAVVVGRCQIAHKGHEVLFEEAFKQANHVLVILGSINQPRTHINTFTFAERKKMVELACQEMTGIPGNYLYVEGVEDFIYEDPKWLREIQKTINNTVELIGAIQNKTPSVVLVGHEKRDTKGYLDKLKTIYDYVEREKFQFFDEHPIDASQIRQLLFENKFTLASGALSAPVFDWIKNEFLKTEAFKYVQGDYEFHKKYKQQWANTPYPVIFQTVDAVVLVGGTHVLLVQRKSYPGKDLWALPGGFLNPDEMLVDGVIRELREETKLKVAPEILRSNITFNHRFDHPSRSLRGRTITDAYLIELPTPKDCKLPLVKGSDDAKDAKWFTLEEALGMGEYIFEDHLSIISMLSARATK